MSEFRKHYFLVKKCPNDECNFYIKNTMKKTCPHCSSPLQNFYNLLNFFSLTRDFTKEELKASFKKLSLFFHPDIKKNTSDDFIFLKEGYDTLRKNKESYIKELDKINELLLKGEVIDEKNLNETLAPNTPEPPEAPPQKPKEGWIKNNPLFFINLLSSFFFGLLGFGLIYFYNKNVLLGFMSLCFFLALGGVWKNAVIFYLIIIELFCLILFSYFIYQQEFLFALLLLPLLYYTFRLFKKIGNQIEENY